MEKTSRKRKIFVLLGLVASAVFILLVALPLWFPWVLPPILKHYGVGYSRYERDGYSRFILRDVKVARPQATFRAEQVEVLFPTTFLWRNFTDDLSENYLRVSDWTLEISRAAGPKKPATNSVFSVSKKLDATLEQLRRWIPKATLDKGTIRVQNREIALPVAEWANGNLSGQISSEKLFPETFFHGHLAKIPKGILIEIPDWDLGGELAITREENTVLKIEGGALWHSNRVDLAAQFGPTGQWPKTAFVKSDSFQIPAQTLKLEGYHDVTGSLDLEWKDNHFTLDLAAHAQPNHTKEIFLSPLSAAVHASGDTNSVRIETAAISSPWLTANLSKNVEFNFRGEMLSPGATLKLAADLSGQNWIDATGQLDGAVILRRGTNRFPVATFDLSGAGIDVGEIEMDRLDLQGELNWPWLQINSARAQFQEGATAQANFKFNAVAREVSGGKLQINGSIGQKFLPPDISYKTISLDAEFSGPLKKLSHAGHVELQNAKIPKLAPLGIVADWRGTQFDLADFKANLTVKDSSLALGGSANYGTNKINLRLENLVFGKNGESILTLEKPLAISAAKSTNENAGWSVTMEPLRWRGDGTELSLAGKLQWPQQGNFSASARQLAFARFRDFSEWPIPEVFLEKMDVSAGWTNGPATVSANGLARFFSKDGTPFSAELRGSGNEKGVSIELARVGTSTESVISGKGFLPLKIVPGSSNLVQILPKQRIDFHAQTIPNTQFWDELARWTQTDFREPRASLLISGTFDAPEGKLTASAKEIILKSLAPGEPVPRLQNLFADFDLAREQITLNRAEVFVEGQPVTASGQFPLPKNLQKANWKKIFDWRKANAQLKIVDAQIAAFERLFPKLLSPLGTVNLDLAIAHGKLDGELRVSNAALRPIPSLGPVHDIEARMKFFGEQVTLETFSGNLGGQPVNLTGQINLAERETNGLPNFHFNLRGTNVPLARSPDLILRSDLDLAIANEKGTTPLVSGEMKLRDSFYLSDLKILVPGKVAKPKQRPPYFSIEAEPFAQWRLNVAVHGTNFLKVRSPLFRGEISANLKLEGTLKQPMILGDTRINSGVVQFPFANLRVDQGFISLTSENPFRPKLSVAASSRTYGYDVKMNVSGFADKPVIEFSSTPGLTSEQILLMLTAGELPRNELNFSTQQKAGRLAFFLGKNLLSKFGATGAGEDKLEIRSGENISEQGKQTYHIEYKLTYDWSIYGEYDRFGGLNAGFKWKFFEK